MIDIIVKKFIDNNGLLNQEQPIIIGISGGADSVALLDILYRTGYKCIAAHCNFHLRDEESNRDALFVEELCKTYNIVLESINFDTTNYAADQSISIEMAARELRYNWFEQLRQKHGAQAISVAHHQDDSVETVLLNLIRGTGIRGLTGIAAKNEYIVRPLLCVTRNEIIEYLDKRQLSYVEDSTNNEDIYSRNKIRLNVIPLLETINPSAKNSINKTAGYLMQVERIYLKYINEAKAEILNDRKINIPKLLTYDEPKAILFEILSSYHFNSATIDEIYEAIEGISGKVFYSETHRLLKDREYLIIDEKKEQAEKDSFTIDESDSCIEYPFNAKIEVIEKSPSFEMERNASVLYLDKNKINYPLTLRHWQQGDWFIPLGMSGKKKISDYFSNQKYSLFDKENIWLLCSGNDIIWVVGKRGDNRYKITDTTSHIIKISLI